MLRGHPHWVSAAAWQDSFWKWAIWCCIHQSLQIALRYGEGGKASDIRSIQKYATGCSSIVEQKYERLRVAAGEAMTGSDVIPCVAAGESRPISTPDNGKLTLHDVGSPNECK